LKSPRADNAAADQQALINQIWGRKIALTRADDRARLTQFVRAGRTANGIGRFADAETAFREALELETDTLKATGLKTKREAVALGLRTLLRLRQQSEIKKLRGRITWEGDLDAMRRDK